MCLQKHDRCTNEFHVERVHWMMDYSQNNQKTDDGQTILIMMQQPKQICSLQNISFLRSHHEPIYVGFYKLNQPTARCMQKTYYKVIQHTHLYDECILIVFVSPIHFCSQLTSKTPIGYRYDIHTAVSAPDIFQAVFT